MTEKKVRKPREKKIRVPREKKVKLSRVERRGLSIKESKIGTLKGSFGILTKDQRYFLILRYVPRGKKKEKIKNLISGTDQQFIKDLGDYLSSTLEYPYNSTPQEKQKMRKQINNEVDVNHSLFKEYNGHCFIQLSFGTIWLTSNGKFHTKRNNELLEGKKIYDLLSNGKFTTAYLKCKALLEEYDEKAKEKILKETIRFGNFEDKNSVRVAMGMDPVFPKYDDKIKKVIYVKKEELHEGEEDIA